MIETKHRSNRLGVWGWLGGGRWGIERYLYTLHRVTGLGLLSYFLMHIFVTSERVLGKEQWQRTMAAVDAPGFRFGEYLVFAAFAIHGINGLRLILLELGFGVGKPTEPVYPYRSSVHIQRPMALGAMLLAGLVAILGGWELLAIH